MRDLKAARYFLNGEALYDVANLEVLIICKAHAAFLAHGHFVNVVFEALELGQLAFVDNDIVANEADFGAASGLP